ncbi:MAG: hypothetical protein ABI891_09115 [Acidobacteriota bacterium]
MANHEFCPHCPESYALNQESWVSLGCLLLMIAPLFIMIFFWLFMFLGFFIS